MNFTRQLLGTQRLIYQENRLWSFKIGIQCEIIVVKDQLTTFFPHSINIFILLWQKWKRNQKFLRCFFCGIFHDLRNCNFLFRPEIAEIHLFNTLRMNSRSLVLGEKSKICNSKAWWVQKKFKINQKFFLRLF